MLEWARFVLESLKNRNGRLAQIVVGMNVMWVLLIVLLVLKEFARWL